MVNFDVFVYSLSAGFKGILNKPYVAPKHLIATDSHFTVLSCVLSLVNPFNLFLLRRRKPLAWLWGIAIHYDDVIMTMLASQITSLTVVYSIVYSGVNQRKHQSSASLAFVREIHRGPVNFPHKCPVTRKMFPFDDVIMIMTNARAFVVICCLVYLYGQQVYWFLKNIIGE